jgi:type I restriction enzyme S subunit
MNQGRDLRTTKEFITEAAVRECKCRRVEPGTVLLSFKLSIGKVGIARVPMFTNEAIAALPIKNHTRVCADYLCWALQSVNLASGQDRAAKGVTLNKPKLLRIELPLPAMADQRRIADILDRAEALRAKRLSDMKLRDHLVPALFEQLFGDPQTILLKWPVRKVGTLLDFLTSGSRGWAAHYAPSGELFLRIQNVRRDELSLDDIAYVNAPQTAEAKRTRVQAGDVLLSITADLGRTAVVPDDIGPAYINQHLSILRSTALEPRFLSAYLASPTGQRQISRRNRQGVKAGLNFDDIRSFVIPTPPLTLQKEFSDAAAAADALKRSFRESSSVLDALFDSLQHRAFRGEL